MVSTASSHRISRTSRIRNYRWRDLVALQQTAEPNSGSVQPRFYRPILQTRHRLDLSQRITFHVMEHQQKSLLRIQMSPRVLDSPPLERALSLLGWARLAAHELLVLVDRPHVLALVTAAQ